MLTLQWPWDANVSIKIVFQLYKNTADGRKFVFNLYVWINADIGADVLDLAETMVASDGLKYEPVSMSVINV